MKSFDQFALQSAQQRLDDLQVALYQKDVRDDAGRGHVRQQFGDPSGYSGTGAGQSLVGIPGFSAYATAARDAAIAAREATAGGEEGAKKAAAAARDAAAAAREQAAAEKEAAEVRAGLGDYTAKLAAEQERLNRLVKTTDLSPEQAAKAMKNYTDQLTGATAAQAKWQALVDAQKTPIDKAVDSLQLLNQNMIDGKITADLYHKALAILVQDLDDLTQQQNATAKGGAGMAQAGLQAVAALNQTKQATLDVRFAEEGLNAILNNQIQTIEDVGRVFGDVVIQMVLDAIRAQAQVGGVQGLGQFFMNVFGSLWGGGGASTPGGGVTGGGGGMIRAGVGHTGGIAGALPDSRVVSLDAFRNAPRFHNGYPDASKGEYAAILQTGEPVVSRFDTGKIVRALDRAGDAGMKITVINLPGQEVTASKRRNPDGTTELKLQVIQMMQEGVGQGALDGPLGSRYGLGRRVG